MQRSCIGIVGSMQSLGEVGPISFGIFVVKISSVGPNQMDGCDCGRALINYSGRMTEVKLWFGAFDINDQILCYFLSFIFFGDIVFHISVNIWGPIYEVQIKKMEMFSAKEQEKFMKRYISTLLTFKHLRA